MIPSIEENEVIFYYKDSKTCGVALNFTRSFIDEKFYVIEDMTEVKMSSDVNKVFYKLFNTMVDIVDIVESKNVVIITIPDLLRATILVYHEELAEVEMKELLSDAIIFILVAAMSNFKIIPELKLNCDNHIVCDEAIITSGEFYQEYYSINNNDDIVVFGSNVISAFTIKVEYDKNNIQPEADRKLFQECIQEMRFTKCNAPLEVRYGTTGYGLKVNLDSVRSDLTDDLNYKVGQLYNSMLALLLKLK